MHILNLTYKLEEITNVDFAVSGYVATARQRQV